MELNYKLPGTAPDANGTWGGLNKKVAGMREASEARRKRMQSVVKDFMAKQAMSGSAGGVGGFTGAPGVNVSGPGASAGGGAWGNPNDPNFSRGYLTQIKLPNGRTMAVHKNMAQSMQGLLTDLWNAGYKYNDVSSYNNRNIAGTNKKSLHAWGAAVDIDPGRNPYKKGAKGFTGSIPRELGYQLANKWGLKWGADFGDSMHFSVRNGPVPWN